MIGYRGLIFSPSDIHEFAAYQKKTFFAKADTVRIRKPIVGKDIIDKIILEIFKESSEYVNTIDSGTLHSIFIVRIKDAEYIIKVSFNKNIKDFNFLLENFISDTLSNKGFPCSKVIAVDISRRKFPLDYQILEKAMGRSLYDLSKSEGINYKQLIDLGKVVGRLHKIKTRKFGAFNIKKIFKKELVGIFDSWKDFLLINIDKHLSVCKNIGALNGLEAKRIKKNLLIYGDLFKDLKPALLHGDLANHNIFVKGDKVSCLIDWEDSLSGDPIFDIAYYGSGTEFNPEWLLRFLEGYRKENNLAEDFLLKYWLYYTRISVLKTVIRHKMGYKDRRDNFVFFQRPRKGLINFESII